MKLWQSQNKTGRNMKNTISTCWMEETEYKWTGADENTEDRWLNGNRKQLWVWQKRMEEK